MDIRFMFLLLICFIFPSICQSYVIYDGFETQDINDIWSSGRFLPKSVEIQSKIVKSGRGAVRITLTQGDQLKEEKGTELERAELMESPKYVSREGCDYSYSFSMFLPKDFPVVPTRLVIAQWKQYFPNMDSDRDDSPVIAVRYADGELIINIKVGPKKVVLFSTKEEIRNKWLDFKFEIHFSRNDDGKIYAWLNEKQIIKYNGKIGYTEKEGFPPGSYYYFKMGLYRDTMAEPMTIYIDEYRKEQLPKESILKEK